MEERWNGVSGGAEGAPGGDERACSPWKARRREELLQGVGLAALFLALLALCWLFPVIGDDWFREEMGRNLAGPVDLWNKVIDGWKTYNGRIFGNILAYAAGSRKVLRELLRALFTLGTIYFAARNGGSRKIWGVLLSAAVLLALPREMFAQIYPWAAGFFNYVPPVALLLAAFWLLRAVFQERPVPEGGPRAAAVFLLGFCSQFFIENYTLYGAWAGVILVVWYRWRQRRWSAAVNSFCAGTLLGALLLFLSPSYGLIWSSGGAYETGLGQGAAGLLATMQKNQEVVFEYLISGCPVLFLSLTGLGGVWFLRSRRTAADWGTAALLAAGCLYFGANAIAPVWPEADPAVAVLWGLALGVGCWRWLPKGEYRNRAVFFWASSAVAALPLLAVSPIGPRCLYLSYVCLAVTAGCLLSALEPDRLPVLVRAGVPLVLVIAVLGHYGGIFRPIHILEGEREAALKGALAAGQTEVVLPPYPHGDYLWEGDTSKVTSRYYFQTPGDLRISFEPGQGGSEL